MDTSPVATLTRPHERQVLITAMEYAGPLVDLGPMAAKSMPPGYRHRYCRVVKYTLADGRTVEGSVRGMTKPKLLERFAANERHIAAKSMTAEFDDKGEYWGTSTRFGL